MGNKQDSLKESALQQQNAAAQAAAATQVQQNVASPYEQALNKEGLDWLNATHEGVHDVSTLPGMSPYIDIYNTASAKQQGQRYGIGSLKLGAEFANPNLLSALQTQDQSHRTQDAGAQLESGFRARDASVRGLAMPLINVDAGRDATNVGATTNMADTATGAWASHRIGEGFWAGLLKQAVNGATSGAAAAAA